MARPWLAQLLSLLVLLPISLPAQAGTGRIGGRVLDAGTGRPIAGARVVVAGAPVRSATSGVDGTYLIREVPAGTHSLTASYIGYGAKTVTGVTLPAGGAATQDITLATRAIGLKGLTVTAERERGSVSRALDDQRTAVGVVNTITSEQISRSPDSDAAQAVQRVSGVTVQDGKFVVVRGLGERYTTTSLNGARIPSPEPEKKVVPLDLFPTSLLESVTTSKTFTPDQPGDFSGALVNIRTRDYPAERTLSLSLSAGYNSAGTGQERVFAPGLGGDRFAFGASQRELPQAVRQAGNMQDRSLSQREINEIASSFRNRWTVAEETGLPNLSASLAMGGTQSLLGRDFGYVASATYSAADEYRVDEVRATTLADTEGNAALASRFEGVTGRTSVLWGGMLNLSTRLGDAHQFTLANSYNRGADNEARRESGFSENLGGIPSDLDRLRYVERSVRSNQLRAAHDLGRHRMDWSVTSSGVSRVEPDRSEILYARDVNPATGEILAREWYGGGNETAVRTFGDLSESALEADANYTLNLGAGEESRIKLGGMFRTTSRDAYNTAYSISAPGTLSSEQRQARPEEIFDGRYAQGGERFFVVTPLGAGGSYSADDRLFAGYLMGEYAPLSRVRIIGGVRVERSEVTVDAQPTFGDAVVAEPEYTDVLPSLALNVKVTDYQNLRFSASQTLSRPEYRELSPLLYRDVVGAENVRGNADLKRTLIQNFDARWEWYPHAGEVLSVGVFAKRFQDPIERVYLASSGTALVTFVNAESGENYGVELEGRKSLDFLGESLSPFSFFTNATLMQSEIRIGGDVASKISDERPMVGQSPYVVNAGLTYTSPGQSTSATVLYNVAGKRVASAAEAPLEDVYEQPRHMLDVTLRRELRDGLSLKMDAKNLLDSAYELRQGGVVREYYRSGRSLSVGVSWNR